MARQATAQKMTAEEARTFEHGESSSNARMLGMVMECDCQPYEDIFTYNRWKAQGFQVQKGEKGKRITVFSRSTKADAAGNEVSYSFPSGSTVFCRCQVKPI